MVDWGTVFVTCVMAVTGKSQEEMFHLAHGTVGKVTAMGAGHIAPTVRKQKEMNAGAQPAFSFVFSLQLQSLESASHI